MAIILRNHQKKSYYFEPNHGSEIDFVIYYSGEIVPLEVKSSRHTTSISFNNFIKKYNSYKAFKISFKNLGVSEDGKVLYLPFYLFDLWLSKEEKFIL